MGLGRIFGSPTVAAAPAPAPVAQEETAVDVEEEERRRRQRLFAGIRTSPLGIAGGQEQTGRSQLLGV